MLLFTDTLLGILCGLIAFLIKEFIKHKKQSVADKQKTKERLTAVEVKIDMLLDKHSKK